SGFSSNAGNYNKRLNELARTCSGREAVRGMGNAAVREGEILAVAARLFREKGYHATSMQDLAEAVGMNRGSFYYYIRTKEDLLYRVMRDAMCAFIDADRKSGA